MNHSFALCCLNPYLKARVRGAGTTRLQAFRPGCSPDDSSETREDCCIGTAQRDGGLQSCRLQNGLGGLAVARSAAFRTQSGKRLRLGLGAGGAGLSDAQRTPWRYTAYGKNVARGGLSRPPPNNLRPQRRGPLECVVWRWTSLAFDGQLYEPTPLSPLNRSLGSSPSTRSEGRIRR